MAKLLTNREAELLRLLLYYAWKANESFLGTGFDSPEKMATLVLDGLSFEIDGDDIAEALEEIRGS